MRQKIFIFLLAAVFLFSQVSLVDAKGSGGGRSSGGSRSSSSKSSGGFSGSSSSKSSGSTSAKSSGSTSAKSSGGFSGSSSSKSTGSGSTTQGTTGSTSNGFSGSSSSRSVPNSYSSKSSTATSSSKASSAKTTYMQDSYNKQASSRNYKTYQQNLNADQQKTKNSSYSRNYNANNRMGFENAMGTRNNRINNFNSRPIFVNVNPGYFGGPLSYGSGFIGCWDLWFLMRASDMFWYHHWNDIHPHKDYFQAAQYAEMEARVKKLEQQNIAKDETYLDPNVDPDLQFSDEYTKQNPDKVYYTNKNAAPAVNPFLVIFAILLIVLGLILIIRFISRPKPKDSFKSRIY